MKKILVIVLTLFLGLQHVSVNVNADQEKCSKKECNIMYRGTSFENNVLSKDSKEDTVILFKETKIESGYLNMHVEVRSNKRKYSFNLSGYAYRDEMIQETFFNFETDFGKLEIVSFYIEENADNKFLHKRNKDLYHEDILRIAIELDGNLYYFEDIAEGIFSDILNTSENSIDFKDIDDEDTNLIGRFSYMLEWFRYYPKEEDKFDEEEEMTFSSYNNDLENGGGGSGSPTFDSNVPQYLRDYYSIFINTGSGFITNGDYMFYYETYDYYMSDPNAMVTKTVEVEYLPMEPGDTRYNDYSGKLGFRLKFLEQLRYSYDKTDNHVRIVGTYNSMRVKNIKIDLTVQDSDLAFRKSWFYGNATKSFTLTDAIAKAAGYVPVIGEYMTDLIYSDYIPLTRDLSISLSNPDNVNVFPSTLEEQINDEKIFTYLEGLSHNYYMKSSGEYFHLEGALVYKNEHSITGYKTVKAAYSFEIYTSNYLGVYNQILHDENNYRLITFYR